MNVKKININQLKNSKYNPRKDLKKDDIEYQKIKRSIEEFGYVSPLIINKEFEIIGGHQRVKVLKELGYEEIDCVVIDNISKEKEKLLNIALNKISGSWNEKLLKDLLIDLDINDLGLSGFDKEELNELINDGDNSIIDEVIEEDVKPEIEFTEELLEEHNYIVLFFDNEVDWLQAQTLFELKSVKSLDSKNGFEKIGIGRVLNG